MEQIKRFIGAYLIYVLSNKSRRLALSLLNSVSFKDGKKYYSNLNNTALLRKTSDEICEEYGLSVLKEKICKSGINFENFYKKFMRDSDYYKFAKEDIDYAIKHSYTLKQFQ